MGPIAEDILEFFKKHNSEEITSFQKLPKSGGDRDVSATSPTHVGCGGLPECQRLLTTQITGNVCSLRPIKERDMRVLFGSNASLVAESPSRPDAGLS